MHIAITQRERVAAALSAAMAIPLFALLGTAEGQESGDVAPAPPSVGADVPLTYFGPAPPDVQKELIGPQKLPKAGQVDLDQCTVTLPLYKGRMASGETIWYIVLDT